MNRWQDKASCRPGTRESHLDWWVEFSSKEDAVAMCAPVCAACPVRVECERAAVENGDREVIRAGRFLGDMQSGPRKRRDGDPCEDCGIPTRTSVLGAKLGVPEGWRLRHAHGFCRVCYEKHREAGSLPESRKLQDGDPCKGCGKPTRSKRKAWTDDLPDGWVRRATGGLCWPCYRDTRAAERQARETAA